MEPAILFSGAVIAFLGLLVGIIIIRLAPEEQHPGKKYYRYAKKIIFFIIISLFVLSLHYSILLLGAVIIFLLVLLIDNKMQLTKSSLVYLLFGIITYYSASFIELFLIELTLIFMYGMLHASLVYKRATNNYETVFISHLVYFAPVIILPFF